MGKTYKDNKYRKNDRPKKHKSSQIKNYPKPADEPYYYGIEDGRKP